MGWDINVLTTYVLDTTLSTHVPPTGTTLMVRHGATWCLFFSFMQPAAVLQIKNVILWHYSCFLTKVCLGRVCIIDNVKEKYEECRKVNLEDGIYLGTSRGQNVVL